MFTGIIEQLGSVTLAQAGRLEIQHAYTDLKEGESIAVNGVCLTATKIKDQSFTADLSPETLKKTDLGDLRTHDKVNLERAVQMGSRLGGHLVLGHVETVGKILSVVQEGGGALYRFSAPASLSKYLVSKGSVTVDGVSLTVVDKGDQGFSAALIPHTLEHTVLGKKQPGDSVNLEPDIMAKYAEELLKPRLRAGADDELYVKKEFSWEMLEGEDLL